jgi:hypothetical protein
VYFQSKRIMKTCRIDDDVISDTVLQVEVLVLFRVLEFLSTNCVTGAGERGFLSVSYNVLTKDPSTRCYPEFHKMSCKKQMEIKS